MRKVQSTFNKLQSKNNLFFNRNLSFKLSKKITNFLVFLVSFELFCFILNELSTKNNTRIHRPLKGETF